MLPTEKDICLVFEYLDNNLLSFRRTHRPIASDPKVIKVCSVVHVVSTHYSMVHRYAVVVNFMIIFVFPC